MRLSGKNTNRGVLDVLKADWIGKNMDLTLLKTVHLCVCIAAFTASAQTRVQLAEPLEWLYPDSKTGTVRAAPHRLELAEGRLLGNLEMRRQIAFLAIRLQGVV